jgi:hypothetical protein
MTQRKTRTCGKCPSPITRHSRTGLCVPCSHVQQAAERTKWPTLSEQRKQARVKGEESACKTQLKEALAEIERLEADLAAVAALRSEQPPIVIEPKHGSGTSEATVVWVGSDWHIEERVGREIGDLNRYDLEIAQTRALQFFQHGLRLTNLLAQDVKVEEILFAALGDFITGNIHGEENAERNQLLPNEAIVFAQRLIISGIEFVLNHSKYRMNVVCKVGNHSRTTHRTRFAAENGHSLEYLMYLHLQAYFRNEPRVTFQVDEGYHSYVQVYAKTLRFHHGHTIKYAGGVGGLFIPTFKALSNWDQGRRADLDVFGHFHQMKDGGTFVSNGSLIGYNAFALSIKAPFEPPRQTLFLVDKKRGRTCTWPILFSR